MRFQGWFRPVHSHCSLRCAGICVLVQTLWGSHCRLYVTDTTLPVKAANTASLARVPSQSSALKRIPNMTPFFFLFLIILPLMKIYIVILKELGGVFFQNLYPQRKKSIEVSSLFQQSFMLPRTFLFHVCFWWFSKEDNLAPKRYLVIYRNTFSCHTWVGGEQEGHSWNLVRRVHGHC